MPFICQFYRERGVTFPAETHEEMSGKHAGQFTHTRLSDIFTAKYLSSTHKEKKGRHAGGYQANRTSPTRLTDREKKALLPYPDN